jgi:transposase InsO family protein
VPLTVEVQSARSRADRRTVSHRSASPLVAKVFGAETRRPRPYLSETERAAAFGPFLHTYNHHRGHTALKGASPADRVPNLSGLNT